jgi:hypothetical protein
MNKRPPEVTFRKFDALQDYYNDGQGNSYSVAKLVDDSKHLVPFDMPLAGLDLDAKIWQDCNIYGLAYHCKRVNEADLTKPIILDWNGSIADGRHRIIKALMLGKRTIKAVRITWAITPCNKGT